MTKEPDSEPPPPRKPEPAEIWGQTFESDEARRAHYIELLRRKSQDPDAQKGRETWSDPMDEQEDPPERTNDSEPVDQPEDESHDSESASGGESKTQTAKPGEPTLTSPQGAAPAESGAEETPRAPAPSRIPAAETPPQADRTLFKSRTIPLLFLLAFTLLPWVFLIVVLNSDQFYDILRNRDPASVGAENGTRPGMPLVAEMEDKIRELESSLAVTEASLGKARLENRSATEAINKLRQDYNNTLEETASLRTNYNEALAEITQLREEHDSLTMEIIRLEKERLEALTKVSRLEGTVASLKDEIDETPASEESREPAKEETSQEGQSPGSQAGKVKPLSIPDTGGWIFPPTE